MNNKKDTFKDGIDYRARGEGCLAMNESRLLHKGRRGQLYVIDFTNKTLIGKGKRAHNKLDVKKAA